MIRFNVKLAITLVSFALLASSPGAYAGKDGKDKKSKKDSQAEIEWEISYLAKRMLDLKGVEYYVIERDGVTKPYIGICTEMKSPGVVLTCVTPDSQAYKSGLKTGDLVTSINDISMANQESLPKDKKSKEPSYWNIVHNMKVGDQLKFDLLRAGEPVTISLKVGSLNHPTYRLEIGKK